MLGQLAVLTRSFSLPGSLEVVVLGTSRALTRTREGGTDGRRGAPLPGSRCRTAADRRATRSGGPGVAAGGALTPLPGSAATPGLMNAERRPFPDGPAAWPERASAEPGGGRRSPSARPFWPEALTCRYSPQRGAGDRACRTGRRFGAQPAEARPAHRGPASGPPTPRPASSATARSPLPAGACSNRM